MGLGLSIYVVYTEEHKQLFPVVFRTVDQSIEIYLDSKCSVFVGLISLVSNYSTLT